MPHIVYKPLGCINTTIANQEKEKLGKNKVCICGKLDPMARGKLLLLFDDECKQMDDYLKKRKIYEWNIIWSLKTDTDDFMGIIKEDIYIDFDINKVLDEMNKFIGNYNQKFHHYSSIHVKNKITGLRKALWEWTVENKLDEIDIPEKVVNVKYIKLLDTKKIEFDDIRNKIIDIIKLVKGKFRQDEIIKQWIKYKNKKLYISTFQANVSSGFYIRQLTKELGKNLGYLGVTLDINRTEIIM